MSKRFLLSIILKQQIFILSLIQQLIVFKRTVRKPKIRNWDRLFWIVYSKLIKNWQKPLHLVQPDTVIRWQRNLYRIIWKTFSKIKRKRKIRVTQDVRQLIVQIASDNKLWGAQRIRQELLKIGIRVAKSTILKIIRRIRNCPDPKRSQRWRTFLANHAPEIWATDFFDVVTVGFKQLYVFVIFSIHTRQILHWNVTEHPTSDWTYRQILQTTWKQKLPKYLLADRDSKYGYRFAEVLKQQFLIHLLRTPFRAPRANAFVERCIGSIRRECLDHFLIFGDQHLRRILEEYTQYYNKFRPHQGIQGAVPAPEEVTRPPSNSTEICTRPILNGLHHHYYRKAA
ncbi:integrase core domain-containing protein [bacterium]|nr:integrase core domain-containing protein [bacterium]